MLTSGDCGGPQKNTEEKTQQFPIVDFSVYNQYAIPKVIFIPLSLFFLTDGLMIAARISRYSFESPSEVFPVPPTP